MSDKVISVDFETFYSTKLKYDLKKLGYQRYCRDEKFDPYLISVYDGTDSWAGPPCDFNWDALDGALLCAHNAAFDSAVQTEMANRSWAPRLNNEWVCTANLTSYICNRRSLADACEFLLKERVDKSVRDDANGKHADDIKAEGKWSNMLEYARGDAKHCWDLWNKYGNQWSPFERRLSAMTIKQGARGIQIDTDLLSTYTKWLEEAYLRVKERLPWVKSGYADTSTIAIAERCRASHIPCPPVKSKEGVEAFDEWEEQYSPHFPWVKAVSDCRKIKKALTFMKTIKLRMDDNGILSFSLKYWGAHTGRWSGDSGLNLQNLRSNAILLDSEFSLTEKPESAKHSIDIRSLFVARSGKKMILCDLSQIEPRTLAWLVGNKKMLALCAQGYSPYEAAARVAGEWTRPDSLKHCQEPEAKNLYKLKKAQEIALGYQVGWQKFIKMAANAGLDVTADDPEWVQALSPDGDLCFKSDGEPVMIPGYGTRSREIVTKWRENHPGEVGLWARLDEAFKSCVGGNFSMELPSGRKMTYYDVQIEWKTFQLPDGKFKKKQVATADVGGSRYSFYGGHLCENLVQATARDVFAEHLLTLDQTSGVSVLFSCHDEAICECEQDVTTKDIEQIMSRTPEWMEGCPLAAEGKEVLCYTK